MGNIRYMIYKVGDKVKIKRSLGQYFGHGDFLVKYNYVLTVKNWDRFYYTMEEDDYFAYTDSHIEGLYVEKFDPITTRWEILDI